MSEPKSRSLILLSCSHSKLSGGRVFDPACRQITPLLGDQREALIARRKKLLKLLRGETGRIHNEDQKGGFRDLRQCNRQLIQGPEFGGPSPTREIYLPAFERYCGRFFDRLTTISPTFWTKIRDQSLEILIVSALYGVLLWDELIQDYDCHLADRTRNGKEQAVSEVWKHTLTSALGSFIRDSKSSTPISTIYDLLSEEEYQRAFRWSDLEQLGVEIQHRVVRNSDGPDILPDLATLVGTHLRRFLPGDKEEFEGGQWYDVGDGTSEVRFEPYVFTEVDNLMLSLKEKHRALNGVPLQTLEDFSLAEALWRKVQANRNLPAASVVISFATAVEGFLDLQFRRSRPERSAGLSTWGGIAKFQRSRQLWGNWKG